MVDKMIDLLLSELNNTSLEKCLRTLFKMSNDFAYDNDWETAHSLLRCISEIIDNEEEISVLASECLHAIISSLHRGYNIAESGNGNRND